MVQRILSDPNVTAAKMRIEALKAVEIYTFKGMLPLADNSGHPSIIHRWNVQHVVVSSLLENVVKDVIWTEAWFVALIQLSKSEDLLSNAWTSVGENKPQVLELKIRYDELLADPQAQLMLLTEAQLSKCWDNVGTAGTAGAIRLLHAKLAQSEKA